MHLTSLRPPTAPQKDENISTTLVPHCGDTHGLSDAVDYTDLDTNANTSSNIAEPDTVCGSVTVDASSASAFFKSLGTYLKTMFKCLYLSYKGWAHDRWKLSALKKNRRWLYISLSILFAVLFIVIVALIVSAATSSTSDLKAELANVKQKEQIHAELNTPHVQASVDTHPASYQGDEVPDDEFSPSSPDLRSRSFDYRASSSYTHPHSASPDWSYPTTGGSFTS